MAESNETLGQVPEQAPGKAPENVPEKAPERVNDPMLQKTFQSAKRILRVALGFALLALGIAMIFTPGPGWLTILLGLGVLAAEFGWARRLLDRLKLEGARLRTALFAPRGA